MDDPYMPSAAPSRDDEGRDPLVCEVERLEQELQQLRKDQDQADLTSRQQALRQAQDLGGYRGRTLEARRRADQLELELQKAKQPSDPGLEERCLTELRRFRADLDQLRNLYDRTVLALSDLRRHHTAALAGLMRPGPVQGAPPQTPDGLVQDYLVLSRSPLMDAPWYRRRNADVDAMNADPILHYLERGWREGRQPGPAFDGDAYLVANPDVRASGVNPLVHYQTKGADELRPTCRGDASTTLESSTQDMAPATTRSRSKPVRITADLQSYEDYLDFRRTRPEAFNRLIETTIRDSTVKFGTRTKLLGDIGPNQSSVGSGDLRECLMSGGISSRNRAIADVLIEELEISNKDSARARVYGHEAVTPLAQLMRSRFPMFLGTEYAPDEQSKRRLLPYGHNDVCDSQFPDESFDATFSCDVLEHVYDLDAALRETARTSVPGGVFLATFPFFSEMEQGSVFAELIDGELTHHLDTPIYHGNPMDEEGGALVFQIPGWDIIARARRAGFARAVMRFVCDEEKGVTASGEGRTDGPRGVFVLVAHR